MQKPCERPIEIPTPAKAHFLALSGIWPTSANQEADDCFRHKRDQSAARVLGMGAGEAHASRLGVGGATGALCPGSRELKKTVGERCHYFAISSHDLRN